VDQEDGLSYSFIDVVHAEASGVAEARHKRESPIEGLVSRDRPSIVAGALTLLPLRPAAARDAAELSMRWPAPLIGAVAVFVGMAVGGAVRLV
jgi:hypothetical protein